MRWAVDGYHVTAGFLPVIIGWVADPDDDVAARSAALLPRLPPGPAASHVLIDVPPRRVPVRASASLALAHSPQPDPRIDQQLHDLLDVPAEPVVITDRHRPGLPPRRPPTGSGAVDLDRRVHPDRLPAVAGWDRALRGFVMLALQRLKSS
ncbi:hypothetical protein [Micromonospora rhizosphaerae]|uniref:hypothetical protein n=1 Tax=Micromonospora rhizosphaerae TaxID=568872 RepID=UPI00114C87B0|nr:hypothetical protein [Micromonospora rhizosphaerae]